MILTRPQFCLLPRSRPKRAEIFRFAKRGDVFVEGADPGEWNCRNQRDGQDEELRRLDDSLLQEHTQTRAPGHSRCRLKFELRAEFSREDYLTKFHPDKSEGDAERVDRAIGAR